MKNYLVAVDMQNDFVDGILGTKEACEAISYAIKLLGIFRGKIFATFDTHYKNYMETAEGKALPIPHCIHGTNGWQLNEKIAEILYDRGFTPVIKHTFGSTCLPELIKKDAEGDTDISIDIIGFCTDICVISNALILKANFPEAKITVIEKCCAGVTPEKHKAAIEILKSCQINVA